MFPKKSISDVLFPKEPAISGKTIFHIPFLSISHLARKLENFPHYNFRVKLNRTSTYLVEKYGEGWIYENIDPEDLVWLVANYRNNREHIDTSHARFEMEKVLLFDGLSEEISCWSRCVENCKPAPSLPDNPREQAFLNELRKRRLSYGNFIRKNTEITPDNCILLK